nr:MAG TPA: Superoxide dismutase [Caudoviricetes sp.]
MLYYHFAISMSIKLSRFFEKILQCDMPCGIFISKGGL